MHPALRAALAAQRASHASDSAMRKQRMPSGAHPAPKGHHISEERSNAIQRAQQAQQWKAEGPREQSPRSINALPSPSPAAPASAIAANPPPQSIAARDNLLQQQKLSANAPSAHTPLHATSMRNLPIAYTSRPSDQDTRVLQMAATREAARMAAEVAMAELRDAQTRGATTAKRRDMPTSTTTHAHQRAIVVAQPIAASAIATRPAGFIPWAQYSLARGDAPRLHAGSGQRTLLLTEPMPYPPGWSPRVHDVNEPEELRKRALEASRIAPAVGWASWERILDEPAATLRAWPLHELQRRQLDAVCAMAGASRLATVRTHLVSLDHLNVRRFGGAPLDILTSRVGVQRISAYARERDEAADARKQLAAARKAERLGDDAEAASDELQRSGAAAAAISALTTANEIFMLGWPMTHPQLAQFKRRPAPRENGGAADAEASLVLHFELGAADETLPTIVRDCHALAALEAHVCVRGALGKRSRRPRRQERGMALGATGEDLKKRGKWRSAGRPLITSVYGYSGSDTWFVRACTALDRDGFNDRRRSLLRAHDGPAGDPSRAKKWLDRSPTDGEWNATLAYLCRSVVRRYDNNSRCWRPITPHLVFPDEQPARMPTKHTLKKAKISLYVALRLHTDYAVEPGAHAGSTLERLSVRGAQELIGGMRPRGLAVALRYARAAYDPQAILETEHAAYEAVRGWIAETGLERLPRRGSWAHLTAWVNSRIHRGDAATPAPTLLALNAAAPEPEQPDTVELVADEAEDAAEGEIEVDWDEM